LPNELTHTVTYGDTVIDLAQRYNSTVDAIIAYNDLSANGVIFVNQELLVPVPVGQGTPVIQPGGGQGDETTYVVQPGDTLFRIAANNNTTVARLAQYNGILNPARIFPGQEILIPPADTTVPSTSGPPTAVPIGGQAPAQVTPIAPPVQPVPQNFIDPTGALIHIVQPGENIFRIGLIYNVTWDRIARANGIFNPNFVIAGQRLVIPR
jgi:LysM repeat protein